MSATGSSVSVTASEVYALGFAIAGSPPDGNITLTTASDGTIHADWRCGGKPASIGTANVVPLKPAT